MDQSATLHPLLSVVLLETEELLVGEHDALHANTSAVFRQYLTFKFQMWKKLLAKEVMSLISLICCALCWWPSAPRPVCQTCFLTMALVPEPSAKSAFKRASVVAVHPTVRLMSVASKEKQLGL